MGGGGGLTGAAPDGAPPPTAPPPPALPAPPPIPPPLAPPDPPAGACVLAAGSVGMTGGVAGCSGLAADGVTGCCATGTDLLAASMALAASGAPPPLAPRPGSAPVSGRVPAPWPCWVSLPPVAGFVSWLVAPLVDWALEEDAPPLVPALPTGLPMDDGPADEPAVGEGDGGFPSAGPAALDGPVVCAETCEPIAGGWELPEDGCWAPSGLLPVNPATAGCGGTAAPLCPPTPSFVIASACAGAADGCAVL